MHGDRRQHVLLQKIPTDRQGQQHTQAEMTVIKSSRKFPDGSSWRQHQDRRLMEAVRLNNRIRDHSLLRRSNSRIFSQSLSSIPVEPSRAWLPEDNAATRT